MKFIVALSFICSVMLSCNNSKKVNEKEIVPLFTFEETACFGSCPVYIMEIYPNGYVKFDGRNFVEKEGVFEKSISESEVERLINAFKKADFFDFEDEYTTNISDLPTVFTTFNYDGKSKKIENYHGAPDELKALEKSLREIAMSQEGWSKIED